MTPIRKLDISARLRSTCEELGITSLEELLVTPEKDLLSVRNFGRTSLAEVRTLKNLTSNNKGLYDIINTEVDKALSSQWNETKDFLPPLDGDISENVLIFNGDYHIAQYHRFKGWVTHGEPINVERWMKIPRQ